MSGMVHDGWYIMMDLDGYFDDNLQDEDVGFSKKRMPDSDSLG